MPKSRGWVGMPAPLSLLAKKGARDCALAPLASFLRWWSKTLPYRKPLTVFFARKELRDDECLAWLYFVPAVELETFLCREPFDLCHKKSPPLNVELLILIGKHRRVATLPVLGNKELLAVDPNYIKPIDGLFCKSNKLPLHGFPRL